MVPSELWSPISLVTGEVLVTSVLDADVLQPVTLLEVGESVPSVSSPPACTPPTNTLAPRCFPDRTRIPTVHPLRKAWARSVNSTSQLFGAYRRNGFNLSILSTCGLDRPCVSPSHPLAPAPSLPEMARNSAPAILGSSRYNVADCIATPRSTPRTLLAVLACHVTVSSAAALSKGHSPGPTACSLICGVPFDHHSFRRWCHRSSKSCRHPFPRMRNST